MNLKRGDYVTYRTQYDDKTIWARVLHRHGDGTVTYRALHALKDGKLDPEFIGYTYRQRTDHLKFRFRPLQVPAGTLRIPRPSPISA
jgi:hypothetical protein